MTREKPPWKVLAHPGASFIREKRKRMKIWFPILIVVSSIAFLLGRQPFLRTGTASYTPQTRHFTMITVPVLTKELRPIYPFLSRDFAQGGVLQGKEVYRFQPETLTVYQGDTVNIIFVNPEDDAHTFVLPSFYVALALPAQATTTTRFVASTTGIFPFICDIPSHVPSMAGTLVVLPDSDARPSP